MLERLYVICLYWYIGILINEADLLWFCPGLLTSAGCDCDRDWG